MFMINFTLFDGLKIKKVTLFLIETSKRKSGQLQLLLLTYSRKNVPSFDHLISKKKVPLFMANCF